MNTDATLWEDRFAPVTSAMGFLGAPLEDVVTGLVAWRRRIHGSAEPGTLPGGLIENLGALEPLTGGVRPRELLVTTANPDWTAIFDCGVQGGDPSTTVGYLARTLKVQGVVVVSIPDAPQSHALPPRWGARQFELFAPIATDFLNYVRTVSLVNDGGRWRFEATGTVQDFEDIDAYGRRKTVDRFTPDMLIDYAKAMGLRPFDEDFYPGPSVLVRNPATPPLGAMVLSLAETRVRFGLAR